MSLPDIPAHRQDPKQKQKHFNINALKAFWRHNRQA
jgi:hypothetical protein